MANYSKKKFKNKNKIKENKETLELADARWYTSPFFVMGIMFVLVTIILSYFMAYSTDYLFLVATGRDIIKNGIPYINNMTWLEGLEVVIQQWLYDVVVSVIFDFVGKTSGAVVTTINLALLFIPIYKTARIRNNREKSFFIASLLVLCSSYIISPRPTLLTEGLLVWQIYICEAKKNKWWIPFLVLLEANFHASYIVFHFVYLLPYIVPGVTKWLEDEHDFKYIKVIPAMIIAMLCNPYGIKGALVPFYSYSDAKEVFKGEVDFFDFSDPCVTIPLFICIIITIMIATNFKQIFPSPAFYVYIGTIAMLIISPVSKNIFFIAIGLLPVTTFLLKDITSTKNYVIEVVIAVVLILSVFITKIPERVDYFDEDYPSKITEYLQEVKPKRLFTTYTTGIYTEFAGMKCFVDNRIELYLKKINGKYDYMYDAGRMTMGTDDAKDRMADKYNFDYYFVDGNSNYSFEKWAYRNCDLIMVDNNSYLYHYKGENKNYGELFKKEIQK